MERRFFNGGKVVTPKESPMIPNTNPTAGPNPVARAIQWVMRYGGLVTYEKPITDYPGDIVLGVGTVVLRAGIELPKNCTGARFIDVTGTTVISINGQGLRTVRDADYLGGSEINTLQVQVTAGACTIQPWGVAD